MGRISTNSQAAAKIRPIGLARLILYFREKGVDRVLIYDGKKITPESIWHA